MNQTTDRLDGFEQALLGELRAEVAQRASRPDLTRRPERALRRLRVGIAAAAVSAVGIAGAYTLTSGSPAAAYDVAQGTDGGVRITIHRLEDADGLEAALADQGLEADVSYEPGAFGDGPAAPERGQAPPLSPDGGVGTLTREGTVTEEQDAEGTVGEVQDDPRAEACGALGDGTMPYMLEREGDDWVISIPAESIILTEAKNLRIATAELGSDEESVNGGLLVSFTNRGFECMIGLATATVR